MQKRFLALPVFLLLLLAIAAACAAPVATDQASIDQAVQATLTAVVAEPGTPADTPSPETVTDDAAQATPIPDAPAAIPQMVLPPEVPNFDPVLRPDKSLGDPNAPVVMYEWSDYT